MTHNEEKNQSGAADPELTRMLGFADKDVKTVAITAFHTLKRFNGDGADIWR